MGGLVTILSPCILPILPIVLAGSVSEGKRRPWGIVAGFVLSFCFFTLSLATLVKLTGISTDVLRGISVVILVLFGLSMIVPALGSLNERFFTSISKFTKISNTTSQGFGGGFILGLSLGLIWAPCVGPILASVITLAASSSVSLETVFITLSYALGTAVPMFLIIIGGKGVFGRVSWFKHYTVRIQKSFGVLMIVVAAMILFQFDRKFQIFVLDHLPWYGSGLTNFESNQVIEDQLDRLLNRSKIDPQDQSLAPDFDGGVSWVNSSPLSVKDLRGKVVLVDFWTYSCINCYRTIPFLNAWYEKYVSDGLVIVGVHSPEFEFEKNRNNLFGAVSEYGIKYPVVQDNDLVIWNNYNNRYWPAKYLIDKDGKVRYHHFGEGKYEETEKEIQKLLSEIGAIKTDLVNISQQSNQSRTRETYLGYLRMQGFASVEPIKLNEQVQYSTAVLLPGSFSLEGKWIVSNEYSKGFSGSRLNLDFEADKVYLVMRETKNNGNIKIYLDGEVVKNNSAGRDVDQSGMVSINRDGLYELIDLPESGRHVITIELLQGEVEVFAFTFG